MNGGEVGFTREAHLESLFETAKAATKKGVPMNTRHNYYPL